MTLLVEKGTFTKTTSTGVPVAQTITLNNASLTPKFVILWTNELTTEATFAENHYIAFGYSDGTTHASQTIACEDNDTALVAGYSFNNDCVLSLHNDATPLATSQVSRCTVTSFAAGQVNLSWSVQTDTSAKVIHYMVGGGTDITNVKVVNSTKQNTSTGAHSWTGAGFQPDFVLTMTGGEGYTTANTIGTAAAVGAGIGIGAACSSTQEFAMFGRSEPTAGTADTDMNLHDNATLLTLSPTDGTETYLADFTSFDSDGITLNVSNGATSGSELVSFLFIKGGKWDVGAFQQRSGTGTQDVTLEAHSDPELLFLAGINSATLNGTVANNYIGIGGSDGTNEGCIWAGDQNAATTMISTRINLTTKVYRQSVPNATAGSSTTTSECDINDMATVGKFQLNWTTAGTQGRIGFWTLGVSGVANFVRSPSAENITVNESLSRSRTATPGSPQNFKCGIITKDTTTGAHTQNFTNELGFPLQAMIVIMSGKTTAGTGAHIQNSVGFTDGTNHYCIVRREINGNNSAGSSVNSFRITDNFTMGLDATTSSSTTISEGKIVGGSNGFDIDWLKADATQNKIIYMAWGGGGFHDCKVTTHAQGSTPWQFTDVGLEGTIVFFLHGPTSTAIDQLNAVCNIGFGVATSTTSRWSLSNSTSSGFAQVTGRRQRTDRCFTGISNGNADRGIADFEGFLSNGFDIGTFTGGTATDQFGSLVIKGGLWDLGAFNQNTSNGTQQVNITTGRTPTGVILATFGNAATTSIVTEARMSIGVSDGTTEASIWDGMQNAAASNYINGSDFSDTKIIRTLDETAGSGTLQTEADWSAFASGSFTVNNTTTDATSREIVYVAFTPESTGTNYQGTPSAENVSVSDASTTRIKSALRVPSTDSTTVADSSLTRMLSAVRVPSSDSTTVTDSSLTRSKTWTRVPGADTIVVTDSSTTRMLSATRVPSTENITINDSGLTRMLSATRVPSSDSITTSENLSGGKVIVRVPSSDSVTVADSSLTRLLSALRLPSSDTITTGENLIRVLSAIRSPSSDSVTAQDSSTTQKITRVRVPTADTTTVSDSSLTRMLSARRAPSSDSITVVDSSLTRILSLLRVPSSDSVATSENVSSQKSQGAQTFERSPVADTIAVVDASLTRILSALRLPGTETITVTDSSLTRMLSLIRVPSTETVTTSESLGAQVSGRISRSVEDTVIVSENVSRRLSATRVPTADTVNLNEQLSRIISRNRVPSSDSISVSDAALTRVVTKIRLLSETPAVVEASLTRMLSAVRSLNDTTVVSEVQGQISLSRRLEETVAVTEPVIQRIVTAIRATTPDIVDVNEQVFFQALHKFVFDSVSVAEQLFSERQALSGSVTYATPDEVRPLLGNIGGQRTNTQIQTAIDSAYDEINRKTGRQPPNDWKDTENDFGIVKKICRFKAALEMAVGIKDFEDREWMQKEIDEMFTIIAEGEGESSSTSTDIVGSSPDVTYALNPQGLIWSVRYQNLKKGGSGENDTTINPDT